MHAVGVPDFFFSSLKYTVMSPKSLVWLLPLACLIACNKASNHERYAVKADSAETLTADTSGGSALDAPDRKIIRTADFNCKVQNVMTAVNSLEHIVKSVGGIVQESRVENSAGITSSVYYKPDSLKEFNMYTSTAFLTLRVPVAQLDSVVQSIPAMVSFIDSRALKQSDVTAHFLGNELHKNIGTKVYTPSKAVGLAKKQEDLIAVQEYEDANTSRLIERKVENLQLLDQANYATITVALAQPPQIFTQVIVDPSSVSRVPFFIDLGASFSSGWVGVKSVFLSLVTLWPLFLLVGVSLLMYRRYRRRTVFFNANFRPDVLNK